MSTPVVPEPVASDPVCPSHPGRETHVRCVRCDRYMCADCMRTAAVGHQCVDCVKEGNKTVRRARTLYGASAEQAVPYVTYSLIGLMVAVYAATLLSPALLDQLDTVGRQLVGPDGGAYVDPGHGILLPDGYERTGVFNGEWYRLLTGAFVHELPGGGFFGPLHLLLNGWWIWTLGASLERQLGWWRYLALFGLSAMGGGVLVVLVSPEQGAIGASGAVYGLIGAFFLLARGMGLDARRTLMFAVVWMVFSFRFTSWEGHLGGLVVGLVLGWALDRTSRAHRTNLHPAVFGAVFAVLAGAAIAGAIASGAA